MSTGNLFSFPRYDLPMSTGDLLNFVCHCCSYLFIFQMRCPLNLEKLVFNFVDGFLHERKFFYGNTRSVVNLFQETGCCMKSYQVFISLQVYWLLS